MSKSHPNDGPTFSKAPPKKRPRPGDGPPLDPSKPELWVSLETRERIDEWIKDPATLPRMARRMTTGRP